MPKIRAPGQKRNASPHHKTKRPDEELAKNLNFSSSPEDRQLLAQMGLGVTRGLRRALKTAEHQIGFELVIAQMKDAIRSEFALDRNAEKQELQEKHDEVLQRLEFMTEVMLTNQLANALLDMCRRHLRLPYAAYDRSTRRALADTSLSSLSRALKTTEWGSFADSARAWVNDTNRERSTTVRLIGSYVAVTETLVERMRAAPERFTDASFHQLMTHCISARILRACIENSTDNPFRHIVDYKDLLPGGHLTPALPFFPSIDRILKNLPPIIAALPSVPANSARRR